jgi:peptidoglycan-associated lipoprotein
MSQQNVLVLGLLSLVLAGCGSKDTIPDPDVSETAGGQSDMDDDYGSGGGLQDGEDIPYDPMADELTSVIYFDYDSSELRPQDTDIVARHARQLGMNPNMTVRLEGHGDERGSREYNIGLGERRAQTVRRLLLIQGASSSQVSTVSFGEERPAVEGSTETAYSQNRRVEFAYTD